MERNVCMIHLSVGEAARTVCGLVERAGLSSKMVDCHEIRQGDTLCAMVLIFEKYYAGAGSRMSMTVVLDNLDGGTRMYWAVTGGNGVFGNSGESKVAAEKYSKALRDAIFPYLDLNEYN